MRLLNSVIIIILLLFSCKEDEDNNPIFDENYGSGLYVATSNGVSFYNDSLVVNQIFKKVNGSTITNIERIKSVGSKVYILSQNSLYIADIMTLENLGNVSGFDFAVDFEYVSPNNRIFVVDREASMVKVVDLENFLISSDIETGDETNPTFIISKSYLGTGRAIVMNGGSEIEDLKDSTIVAIDYRNRLVPLSDMMGSLYVGDNPNSAVNNNNLKVLCKGIYNPNNLSTKTLSSLVTINPWDMQITNSQVLTNVYNANNLISNADDTEYYFSAEDGFYKMNTNGNLVSRIDNLITDVLYYSNEEYSIYSNLDSTTNYFNRNVLYVNDSQNSKNVIYKYNLDSETFMDTIVVEGDVKDILFY